MTTDPIDDQPARWSPWRVASGLAILVVGVGLLWVMGAWQQHIWDSGGTIMLGAAPLFGLWETDWAPELIVAALLGGALVVEEAAHDGLAERVLELHQRRGQALDGAGAVEQHVGRGRGLGQGGGVLARDPPRRTAPIHAPAVAQDRGEPRADRPIGRRRVGHGRGRGVLDQIVGVGPRQRARQRAQPLELERQVDSGRCGHAEIMPSPAKRWRQCAAPARATAGSHAERGGRTC